MGSPIIFRGKTLDEIRTVTWQHIYLKHSDVQSIYRECMVCFNSDGSPVVSLLSDLIRSHCHWLRLSAMPLKQVSYPDIASDNCQVAVQREGTRLCSGHRKWSLRDTARARNGRTCVRTDWCCCAWLLFAFCVGLPWGNWLVLLAFFCLTVWYAW